MNLEDIHKQIGEMSERANEAVQAAKASAEIAYKASIENVKSNKNLEATLNAYIKEDMDWKKRAEPAIELGNNARGASKAVLWLGGIILVIGGAWQIIKTWFLKAN